MVFKDIYLNHQCFAAGEAAKEYAQEQEFNGFLASSFHRILSVGGQYP